MRCPVCRADNNEGSNCRRCRADLSLLCQLEARRTELLRQAHQHAALQNWPHVSRLAREAHALRRGSDSTQLAAIAALMEGGMTKAWEHFQELHAANQ
jgi:hypothetical protein